MRHAKAAYPESGTDHERPLASRGRKDAPEVGRWLAEEGLVPQLVLCSDAARTVETAEGVVSGTGENLTISPLASLYESHVGEVVEAVQTVADSVSRVLVVGHEPTMSATVAALTGQHLRFPTSGVAVVELSGSWRDLEPDSCRLEQFRIPKES